MNEPVHSKLNRALSNNLENGLVLNVTMQDLKFTAYVLIAETDLEQIAEIVPYEEYLKYGSLHVSSVDTSINVKSQIDEISFNMDFDDGLVLFCANNDAYKTVLSELGYKSSTVN